jgi:hypothetical protein
MVFAVYSFKTYKIFDYYFTCPLQLLVQSPSHGGRAILHLKTVHFADSFLGPNVIGVNTYMDIQRTFKVIAGKTQNLNTHMQVDSMYVDFGFITNAGQIS